MKRSFSILKTIFLTLGTIVGAGFMSGKEPISYFGSESPLISSLIVGAFFFIILMVVFFDKGKLNLPTIPVILALLTVCASLLASIDALSVVLGFYKSFPIFSFITLIICPLICGGEIKRLEQVNLILSPLLIIFVVIAFILTPQNSLNNSVSLLTPIKAIPFVLTNLFLALPVLKKSAKNIDKKQKIITAILVSLMLSFILFVVLSLCGKNGAENYDLPIIHFINGKLYVLTLISLSVATITSVFALYYPLHHYFNSAFNKSGSIILMLFLAIFSRLGVSKIIEWGYPLISIFGAVYLVRAIIQIIRYKKGERENNKYTLKNMEENYVQKKEKQSNTLNRRAV